jgi:hypothetical protein
MDADRYSSGWLMLLTQLPSKPSSARVALWRRMRAAGATALVNGAWALPCSAPYAEFFEQSRESIIRQGGIGFMLRISASSPETNEAIVRLFRADRAREYDEFAERCTAFLNEINRESNAGKYTFAEMEESEQDLEKLARWLVKIQARDFFPDGRREQSAALLARCRSNLEGFSQAVYTAEGVQDREEDVAPAIAETATERTAAPEPEEPPAPAAST